MSGIEVSCIADSSVEEIAELSVMVAICGGCDGADEPGSAEQSVVHSLSAEQQQVALTESTKLAERLGVH